MAFGAPDVLHVSALSRTMENPRISFVRGLKHGDAAPRTPPGPSMFTHSIVFACPVQGLTCVVASFCAKATLGVRSSQACSPATTAVFPPVGGVPVIRYSTLAPSAHLIPPLK